MKEPYNLPPPLLSPCVRSFPHATWCCHLKITEKGRGLHTSTGDAGDLVGEERAAW